ncbi:unnamed protein product [Agarophyton chilense]
MSTQTIILSHFANLKLAGDRVVRDAVHSIQSVPSVELPRHARHARPTRRRRARRYKHVSSRRVNAMSDSDLEAELATRRAARAKERERYAKAMRSEKLALLESELLRLRTEISRMDRTTPLGGGTPPTARWEPLPNDRRSSRGPRLRPAAYPSSSPIGSPPLTSVMTPTAPPARPVPGAPPGPPPMPPPPPPNMPSIDPEKQKREKLERQRRREAKRKEREAAKKPLTLADIIKSAGPNPASRLKPSGSTPLPDVDEPQEEDGDSFANLKDTLKKSAPPADSSEKPPDSDPEQKSEDTSTDPQKEQQQSSKKDKREPKAEQTTSSAAKVEHTDEPKPSDSEAGHPNDTAVANKDSDVRANAGTQDTSSTKDTEANKPDIPEDMSKSAAAESAGKSNSDEQPANSEHAPVAPKVPSPPNGLQSHANGSTPFMSTVDESPTKPLNDAGDTMSALSALSALTAKLPNKSSPSTSASSERAAEPTSGSKRLSLQEKRRLRREAKESASVKND